MSKVVLLKEFELLFLQASYPNKTYTRDQLIEKIWALIMKETNGQWKCKLSENLLKLTYLEADKYGFTPKEYRLD